MKNSFVITLRQILCLIVLFFPRQSSAEDDLDLTVYHKTERLFLAALPIVLRPADSQVISNSEPGDFQLLVESGAELKKDELWAVFDPEGLELERALLEADRRSLPEEIAKALIAQQEEIAQFEEAIKLIQVDYDRLEYSLQEPEVQEDQVLKDRVVLALNGLGKQLNRARQRLALAEKGGIADANIERMKLNMERKEATLEEFVKKAEKRAPFEGVIQFLDPLNEGEGSPVPRMVFVPDIEALAVLKNENRFEIELEPLILDFNGVTRSRLFISVDSEKGEGAIRADFAQVITNQKDPSRVDGWLFKVLDEDADDVKDRTMGNRALASVFLDLTQPAIVIPKGDLLKHLPESEEAYRGDWNRLITRILPEYEFVAEGRGAVAVREKEKAKE